MKKAKDYVNKLYVTNDGDPVSIHDSEENVLDIIKEAQQDAIKATILMCSQVHIEPEPTLQFITKQLFKELEDEES